MELINHTNKCYYYNSKKYGELDFVLEHNGEVLVLEIKSGKEYKKQDHRSKIQYHRSSEQRIFNCQKRFLPHFRSPSASLSSVRYTTHRRGGILLPPASFRPALPLRSAVLSGSKMPAAGTPGSVILRPVRPE